MINNFGLKYGGKKGEIFLALKQTGKN